MPNKPNSGNTSYSNQQLLPEIVKLTASPDLIGKIDNFRFPIDEILIAEMPRYLDEVNKIIAPGNLGIIRATELLDLQDFLRNNNDPDKIIFSQDILSARLQLWIEYYLELRIPTVYPDDIVGPPTKEQKEYEESFDEKKTGIDLEEMKERVDAKQKIDDLLSRILRKD